MLDYNQFETVENFGNHIEEHSHDLDSGNTEATATLGVSAGPDMSMENSANDVNTSEEQDNGEMSGNSDSDMNQVNMENFSNQYKEREDFIDFAQDMTLLRNTLVAAILFVVLSSSMSYKLTGKYLKNANVQLGVHVLLFALAYFLLNKFVL